MTPLLRDFIAYLEQEVKNHSMYVWGAQGKRGAAITEEWIRSREKDADNAARAITFWKKQVAAGYGEGMGAFDCSGLGMYWLQNLKGLYNGDASANTLMGRCKKLTRAELSCGDWVFRADVSGHATHIGYVVDDHLNVIEAKGRDDGVVKRALNASGTSYWNAYGRPGIFERTEDGTLRLSDTGDAVKRMQELLLAKGYALPLHGADGDFGAETEAAVKQFQMDYRVEPTGIVDKQTLALLEAETPWEPVTPPEPPAKAYAVVCTGGSVYFRAGPGKEYLALGTIHKGDRLLVRPAVDGWHKAAAGIGEHLMLGYISASYVKEI